MSTMLTGFLLTIAKACRMQLRKREKGTILNQLDPRGIVSVNSSHIMFSFCFQLLLKLLLPYMYECRSRTNSNKKEEKCADKIPMVPLDSPAMGTRSKKCQPSSPAMSTRSRRRLSL